MVSSSLSLALSFVIEEDGSSFGNALLDARQRTRSNIHTMVTRTVRFFVRIICSSIV